MPDYDPTDPPVAIVTGAGSGIGRAIAVELANLNCRVVLAGRRAEPLRETAARIRTAAVVVPTDISSPKACEALVKRAIDELGRVDVLINNAGWAPCMPIDRHTPEIVRQCFEINALGPAYLTIAVWKAFLAQNATANNLGYAPPGGCIVNISSMATVDPFPGLFAYAGAKAANNLFIKSAHNEGRDHGIRCFCVAPGAVETEMLRGIVGTDVLPTERTLPPEAVAAIVGQCVGGAHDDKMGETLVVPSPAEKHEPPAP